MVDSKEIEELRALVFASIPAVARKATGSSTAKRKRRYPSFETEEGEILSDEDTAAAVVMTPTVGTSASEIVLDHPHNASDILTKQSDTPPVSMEFPLSVSTESPNLVAVVPSCNHMSNSEEISNLASNKASVVWTSKDESGTMQAAVRVDSATKNESAKVNQQVSRPRSSLRPFRTNTGSLPSRIPTVPMPTGGLRKEADAFLASLNIPAMPGSSHLPVYTEDRHNSLVIKFSDDDSDSDGEQDRTKKLIGSESQVSSSRMGLMSQTTSGLISEIDRVKKQIAAIERAKSSPPVSRPLKSTVVEVPRQLNMKPGVPTITSSSRMVPVDLESLRQQIAAKESELKRRKQRGSKEFSSNGTAAASSWLTDTLEMPGTQLLPIEKSESETRVMEVYIEDAPTISECQRNEVLKSSNGSLIMIERFGTQGPNFEHVNSLVDGFPAMVTSPDVLPVASATEFVTLGSDAQFSDNNVEQASNETMKPVSEKCDLSVIVSENIDTTNQTASLTPKRKRQVKDYRSESVKRAKKGRFPSPERSLMLNGSKEGKDCQSVSAFLDGSCVASIKVPGGIQSSQSNEPLMPVQGMPMRVATIKPQNDKYVQTSSMQKASDGTDFAVCNFQVLASEKIAADKFAFGTALLLQTPCPKDSPTNEGAGSPSKLDGTAQDADRLKHLSTSIDMNLSTRSSPSRAMEEEQEMSGILSGEHKVHQGTLAGVSSACSSLPVWDCGNAHVQLLQGVSDQRLDYASDSLWKLHEEEDAVDKELEEAQQNRRRCEVQEHLARKQYRDAQETLHLANARCEMLFQKREMLSAASVKAAHSQMYLNRSFTPHRGEGALISLSVPGCSGKDSFSFGAAMWTRDRGKKANEIYGRRPDQDYEGSHSDVISVFNQGRNLSRFPPDRHFISETQQPRLNISGLEEAVVFSTSETMEGLSSKPDVSVNAKLGKVSPSHCLSPPKVSTLAFTEIGSSPVAMLTDFVSRSKISGKNSISSSEEKTSSIAAAINGSTEMDSHGFSSASFTTDLWTDRNQITILGEKSNMLKEQEGNMRESTFSSMPFQHINAHVSLNERRVLNNSINELPTELLKVHPTMINKVSICTLKSSEQDLEPECVACLLKPSGLSQEQPRQVDEEPVAGGIMDGGKKQVLNTLTGAGKSLNRQDSAPLEAHISSADILSKLSPSKDLGMELDDGRKSKETMTRNGKLIIDSPILNSRKSGISENHELHVVNPGKEWHQHVENAETELDIFPVHKKVFKMSEKKRTLEQFTSSISFVTSAGLNLLFSHAPDSHSVNIWKQLIISDKADERILSMSENFESPLVSSFYEEAVQAMDVLSPRALSRLHQIDPHKVLCIFEHRGKCNNDECIWQHKRDYLLSSQKQSQKVDEASNCPGATEATAKDLNSTLHSKHREADEKAAPLQNSWKWNGLVIKAPVYSIGWSHFTRMQSFESLLPGMFSKPLFGSGLPFLALHGQSPEDLPCLFDSSLKLPTLNDGFNISRQLRMEDKVWIQDEGHDFGALGDSESLLEAALELLDYDMKAQKLELQKSVLYVLSRGLEANPSSVALWVVYLHLFNRWERDFCKDDLFLNAVQHNDGSYELWLMFINTRGQLKDRLEAYESAIIALGNRVDIQCHASESKSSLLLDLALRHLNCLCTSDLNQEATSWISNFTLLASEDEQALKMRAGSSSLTLLACLTRHDLCVLWISCAYVMLRRQLPDNVVESLGCKQELFSQNIWPDTIITSSCASQVMKLMEIAASHGKGCMKLDVQEPEDKNLRVAKEVFAAKFVQCAAVCEGLDCSLTLAEKYFKIFSSSVELTLLRARLEECYCGKVASLEIFEEALTRWPWDQAGKMRLWNQYIECAYEAKGPDFVKELLARCAKEICDSDSFRSVCGNLGTICSDTEQLIFAQQQGSPMPLEVSNASLQSVCQLLPSIVKRQQTKGSGFSSQRFSFQDVVFAYVNLAFFKTLDKDYNAARSALQNGLNVAVDADSMRHCLKEIAVFTYKGLDNATISSPIVRFNKMLSLVDRCIVESQLIGAVHPLSRGFCGTIKRRRVSQFVESLVCPLPTDSSFLNSLLESIHGPSLLPNETLAWTDLLEIAEKLLEILPSNVRLATSICRAVQNKVSELDPKTRPATLFWCTSLLIDALCQTSPEAPEPRWVEAGGFLKLLEVDSLLEDFYWLALLVHPFSTSLWHGLLEVSRKTGNFELALKSAKERGVRLDMDLIS